MEKKCKLNIYVRRWPIGPSRSESPPRLAENGLKLLSRVVNHLFGFLLDHLDGGTCYLGLVDELGMERIFAKGPKRRRKKFSTKCLNLLSATIPVRAEILEWKSEIPLKYDDTVSIRITRDQYDRALVYATIRKQRYHLIFNNCANFTTGAGVYADIVEIPRFFLFNAPFVLTYWIWRQERNGTHHNATLHAETLSTRLSKEDIL